MKDSRTKILNNRQVNQKIERITYEIYENHYEEKELVLVGIANRGYKLAERIADCLERNTPMKYHIYKLTINKADPLKNDIEQPLDRKNVSGKVVILVDDVLNTGRTLAYGVKHLLGFPIKQLNTVVLVNRRHRLYPIRADFDGLTLATTMQEHISVVLHKGKEAVYLE
ncbi:MAG: phosphoribosyltransferase family protein [Flavobacteriales bacterium]